MAARNDVLLTLAQVDTWQKERDALERDIREKSESLRKIKIKLEAAEIFAGEPPATRQVTNGHAAPANEAPESAPGAKDEEAEAESVADIFCADMRKTGASLKVAQVRKRLEALGFADMIRQKPNYVYGLVYRLTKSGRLLRRGSRYRAAPIGSPEGETEAVGASVRH
ncbi:MAG: hypothetical protein ACREC1_06640 [Methylovirgula sp.]